jgi:hypothetical protein
LEDFFSFFILVVRYLRAVLGGLSWYQQLHHYFVDFIFFILNYFFLFLDNFDGLILKINFKK